MQALIHRFDRFLFPFYCHDQLIVSVIRNHQRKVKTPELPPEIWLEIFQFATYVHRATTIAPLDPFTLKHISNNAMGPNTPYLSMRTKCALVLVCRAWRRVAVQMLYEHIVIGSPRRAIMILDVLQGNSRQHESDAHKATIATIHPSEYGQWTRHIEIFTHARGAKTLGYLETIYLIFKCCPNVRMLSGTWVHPLPVEFLYGISRIYGPSLQGLCWNEEKPLSLIPYHTLVAPEFLASFTSLRILDLRNLIGSDISERSKTSLPSPILPCVQDLILSTHSQSLTHATLLSLPALLNLTLEVPMNAVAIPQDLISAFLDVHGHSIVSVDLLPPTPPSEHDADTNMPQQARRFGRHIDPSLFLQPNICPNLLSLTFPHTSPPISCDVHPTLRRIGLRGVKADWLYPNKSDGKTHLMSFTPRLFPSLEVIRTVGFLVDADTDGLVKDIFIWWAERFDKQGIDFQDGEGVLWLYTDPVTDGITDEDEDEDVTADVNASKGGEERECDRQVHQRLELVTKI